MDKRKMGKRILGECSMQCKDFDFERMIKKVDFSNLKPELRTKEIIAPIRLVLLPGGPGSYRKRVWGSSVLTSAYFALGATFITTFYYVIAFKLDVPYNMHFYFYTMGFQAFMPCALLSRHTYNGISYITLRPHDRKKDYFGLKFCCYLCVTFASYLLYQEEGKIMLILRVLHYDYFSFHAAIGMIAIALLGMDVLFILCLVVSDSNVLSRTGVLFALPSFVTSLACFVSGLIKDTFISFIPKHMYPFLMLGIAYYAAIIIYDTLRNLAPKYPKMNTYYL